MNNSVYQWLLMRAVIALALSLSISGCSVEQKVDEMILIDGAYINKPVSGRPVTAGGFELTNLTEDVLSIVAIKADDGVTVEMHETTIVNDIVSMAKLKAVEIEPGETLKFSSQGKHLMIRGLDSTLSKISLDLCFADNKCHSVEFEVR